MTYDDEMSLGRDALLCGEWLTAYAHFGKAHGLGHDVRRQHLAAHRACLRAAWAGRSPGRIGTQLFLLTWAFVLERDRTPVGA
ncbi:hypothetical protein JOF56_002647 [Kibdelosporangium banguiense]|uniref:DUF3703 domain-containing protein n=1 Tax=Kibdelosporangium banguiense TaxID=1365924 RepID=A0ABS4TCV0_9PSEU|nr:DUF3703 domain-containing protein [Kibdelosporangium banguiense]MBP2322262.1 hypothetical protein [Kibdelosporangium banguiense]